MRGCSRGRGHAWLLRGGACVVAQGGMHGCSGGARMVALGGGGHAWDTMRYGDMVILLECILVISYIVIMSLKDFYVTIYNPDLT